MKNKCLLKLKILTERLGLNISFARTTDKNLFVDKTIRVIAPIDKLAKNIEEFAYDFSWYLAHELGHYLVAPRGRRSQKDYGIPNGTVEQFKKKNQSKYDLEEAKADLIGNYLIKTLGGKQYKKDALRQYKKARNELRIKAYDWWDSDGQKMIDILLDKLI